MSNFFETPCIKKSRPIIIFLTEESAILFPQKYVLNIKYKCSVYWFIEKVWAQPHCSY